MTTNNRTLDQSTHTRITYEQNQLEQKRARLTTLQEGTPAYKRCVLSIDKTAALIERLRASLVSRSAKRQEQATAEALKPRKVRTGTQFDVVSVSDDHPGNDTGIYSDLEQSGSVAA